jgi:hypothetical protein
MAETATMFLQEIVGEDPNILTPRPQRWDLELEAFEPKIEVLAEPPVGDELPQGLVGGRDDADIGMRRPVRPEWLDRALMEEAQQARLEGGRGLGDLVEENGAAVRRPEEPEPVTDRPGASAALVAEKLRAINGSMAPVRDQPQLQATEVKGIP